MWKKLAYCEKLLLGTNTCFEKRESWQFNTILLIWCFTRSVSTGLFTVMKTVSLYIRLPKKPYAKRRGIFKWAESGKSSLGRLDPEVADQLKPQWISLKGISLNCILMIVLPCVISFPSNMHLHYNILALQYISVQSWRLFQKAYMKVFSNHLYFK